MKEKITGLFLGLLCILLFSHPVYADTIAKMDTPDYKVSYYAFDA